MGPRSGERARSLHSRPQGTQDQPAATEGAGLKGIHGAVGRAEYQGAADATENKMQTVAEQAVGKHQPRKFKEGQSVALRDYHPNATAKWRQGTVVHQMGPFTYEVKVDGQVRSAHIDHLKPWPVDSIHTPEQLSSEPLAEETSTTPQSDSNMTASILIPATEDTEQDTTHSTATSWPQHSRRPPRWLIEEIA